MTEFDAVYYDGRSSARNPVRVRADEGVLHIRGEGVSLQVPLAEVEADPPLGDLERALHLPGGGELRVADPAALPALFPRRSVETWVHGLERRWAYAIAAIAITAAVTWWAVVYGVPIGARIAAGHIPRGLEEQIGRYTLDSIDRSLCNATGLDKDRQQRLQRGFSDVTAGLQDGYRYRLELRNCRAVGPNAFALPGGIIVMTDQLVALAKDDAHTTAVLAHEVGHVRHQHGLRLALQAAGVTALVATLAGDAVSLTGLAVTLPTALLQTGYSRGFEDEADEYAFRRLKEIGISPRAFAEIMERLDPGHDKAKAPGYLSTHPATARRIERALQQE